MYSESFKKEIYDLACEGKSDLEIERLLFEKNISLRTITMLINNLNNSNSKDYNKELYNEIVFKRNVFNNLIDKDYIKEITRLIFEGFLLIEIASIYGKRDKDIRNDIAKLNDSKYIFYDPELYIKLVVQISKNDNVSEEKINQKLQDLKTKGFILKNLSAAKYVNDFEKVNLVRNLIQDYLESNMTLGDQYLATKYNISVTAVQKYLKGQDSEQIAFKLFSEDLILSIIKKREEKLIEVRNQNRLWNVNTKDLKQKEEERRLYSSMPFWLRIIFSFRLTLEELAKMVKFEDLNTLKSILFKVAMSENDIYPSALKYMFSEEKRSPGYNGFNEANRFLLMLSLTKNRDTEKYTKMIHILKDEDYKQVLKKKASEKKLNSDDYRAAILYKIKYALSSPNMPFETATLNNNCPEDLKEQLQNLNEYHTYVSIENRRQAILRDGVSRK